LSVISSDIEKRKGNALTMLHVSLTGDESLAYWFKRLSTLISISVYPTTVQATELSDLLDIVYQKGGTSHDIVEHANQLASPNKTLFVLLAVHLAKFCQKSSGKDASTKLEAEELSSLIPSVESIIHFFGAWHGETVDTLKDAKYTHINKKTNFTNLCRKAIILSLSRMSWLGLCDCFKASGICKAIFRNLHITSLLKQHIQKVNNKGEDGMGLKMAYLVVSILRGCPYPKSPDCPAWQDWTNLIIPPLKEVSKNKLFRVDGCWLEEEWNDQLQGKRLAKPVKRDVQGILAQDGNCSESWDLIFDSKIITPAQVLQNIRSLIFLNYPLDTVALNLLRGESLTYLQLLKVYQFVKYAFRPQVLEQIANAQENECAVFKSEELFKDAKGNVKKVEMTRKIGEGFNKGVVEGYLDLIEKTMLQLALQQRSKPDDTFTTCVIPYTPELRCLLRSGQPPSIPSYTRTELWKAEGVCLQELLEEGEDASELIVGITWCQKPDSNRSVDLDLSLMLYDEDFHFLDHCSFQNLAIGDMCVHSGDLTYAPYPEGARESVRLKLHPLKQKYEKLKYIVLVVLSYTGVPLDELHDASIFCANALRSGTAPGGMDVISAAKLGGSYKTNLSGFLRFDHSGEEEVQYFYCLDQNLSGCGSSVTSSTTQDKVKSIMEDLLERIDSDTPTNIPLAKLAAFYSALLADQVILLTQQGEKVIEFNGEEGETEEEARLALFKKLESELANSQPITKPSFAVKQKTGASERVEKLIVFGGDIQNAGEIALANKTYTQDGDISFVNLHSVTTSSESKKVPYLGSINVVTGFDVLHLL